jgi:ketosteroid isomerase-like protein
MKLKLLFFATGILICAACVARGQRSVAPDASGYIKKCEREWAESLASGDASQVKQFLADDFLGVDPDGSFYNREKAISETVEGPKEYLSNHLNDHVKIRFYGDAAVAQGSEDWVMKNGDKGSYVWTDTWIHRNGKWQVVAAADIPVPQAKK